MTTKEKSTIANYMIRVKYEHIDPITNELSLTRLAEDAAFELDLYEYDGYTIPEEVFELAVLVGDRHQRGLGLPTQLAL